MIDKIVGGARSGPIGLIFSAILLTSAGAASTGTPSEVATSGAVKGLTEARLAQVCTVEAAQAVTQTLKSTTVTVQGVPNGPFKQGAQFVAARGGVPASCQYTGSFITNPQTGKTANFLATFPANWNGKYLQIGCSGHCGQFYVSNPMTPSVIVTTQGEPGQILKKGYAIFATDEGHTGMAVADWALRKDGTVDQDFLDDFYYRADTVLADMGKELTQAFYANASGGSRKIGRSYFAGCSGGGRDALVAASYFPEKFDGIIAGSPYDPTGMGIHSAGFELAAARSKANALTPQLFALLDQTVKAQCDAADGVKDGIIQNPLACNFRADRDLPRCTGDQPGGQCFTSGQIESVSAQLTAMTDEQGNVLQPGYSVSELLPGAGIGFLGVGLQKIFVHKNDPKFSMEALYSFRTGGPGAINAFRVIYPAKEAALVRQEVRLGAGHLPENMGRLTRSKTKLLLWHNWSDERLTPISSINYYNELARRNGGFGNIQKNARMFMLPGTAHCSIMGNAPNEFDALGKMEDWVERGQAPELIQLKVANHQFSPGAPPADALKFPNWTAKVCKYPELARYSGSGDMKDAANWSCSPNDRRGLVVGESGRLAGAKVMR